MIETSAETETQKAARQERIAVRAYEISQSEDSGSDLDNWLRAKRELAPEQGDQN